MMRLPSPHQPTFSLIIPTYNPGASAGSTWNLINSFLASELGQDWEVLFVCDGCTDDTPEKLKQWSCSLPVTVISYPTNRGKGFAVYQGLAAAKGQYRIFTDFDMSYTFDAITKVANRLTQGSDVVIASRMHKDSQINYPSRLRNYVIRRKWQSWLFTKISKLIVPLPWKDTQAGLKGFSERAVAQFLPLMQRDGFEFDCEILFACLRGGIAIEEIPVSVSYNAANSTTSYFAAIRMLWGLWCIRRQQVVLDRTTKLKNELQAVA